MNTDWDLRQELMENIKAKGGFVNTHTHLDRAYTITRDQLPMADAPLQQKWQMVDEIKRDSSVEQIYDRMAYALEKQQRQGVKALGSFIDVDSVVKDKSIKAAIKLRERNGSTTKLLFINQTLKGVLDQEAYKWFVEGSQFVDIIGGLPGKDKWFEAEHLDVLFSTAKKLGKMVHVHVDQFNSPCEKETEILVQKTIEHGLMGRVVAIHGISIAAKDYTYRSDLYRKMRQAKISLITCPTAWIDSRRCDEKTVSHNAIAPVEELMQAGIDVALGCDNIADIYKPFTDGDMWMELRFLLESCHYYDFSALTKIATVNGLKVLGLDKQKRRK